jgi:hypothetical protein
MHRQSNSRVYQLGANLVFLLVVILNLQCTLGDKSKATDGNSFTLGGDGALPTKTGIGSGATSAGSSGVTGVTDGVNFPVSEMQKYLDYLKGIINLNGFYSLNPRDFPSSVQDLIQQTMCQAYITHMQSYGTGFNDDTYRYTAALVMDVLQKVASPKDMSDAIYLLNTNGGVYSVAGRTFLANSFLHSPEFYDMYVSQLYQRFYKRAATTDELSFHRNALLAGDLTPGDPDTQGVEHFRNLVPNFLGEEHYMTINGGSIDKFVDAVYRDVVGRAPAASEKTNWLTKLNNNVTRWDVADLLYRSSEVTAKRAINLFMSVLGRMPFAGDVNDLSADMQTGSFRDYLSTKLFPSDNAYKSTINYFGTKVTNPGGWYSPYAQLNNCN